MPASMIIAPAGSMWNVSGSSMAMVAGGPRPGSTPMTVPRNTPTKHHIRLPGCSATSNPCSSPCMTSIASVPEAERQRNPECLVEHGLEQKRTTDRERDGESLRATEHHRDNEPRQQRKADHETRELQERRGHHEGC